MSRPTAVPSDGDGVPSPPPQFRPFERLRSESIYASPWVGLRRDVVRLPSGAEQEYHLVEITDAVAVVPVLGDSRVALVGQYRYPHGKTHWEIPAGRINPGESPREAAARELLEETGLRAGRLEPLPGFYPTNGISAHFTHAFVAIDCEIVGEPQPEESEQLFRKLFTRREVETLLDAGRFEDAFTALCIAYWLRRSACAT